MFCKKCGTEIKEGEMFCGNCGYKLKLESSPNQQGEQASVSTNQKSNKKKGIVITVITFLLIILAIFVIMLVLNKNYRCSVFGHKWLEATCVDARSCSVCGAIEGEALGHTWVDADCITPKHCSVCGLIEGDVLEHQWEEATCTKLKTCHICGTTEGNLLPHQWVDATCIAPKTCSMCGLTEGDLVEHEWLEATYDNPKTCTVCGLTDGEPARGVIIITTDGSGQIISLCEYNALGNVIAEGTYHSDGSIDWYKYEYEYNTQGDIIEKIKYRPDGSVGTTYEYDVQGNIVKEISYGTGGIITSWHEYEYGTQKNMLKDSYYHSDGSLFMLSEYDMQGNEVKNITYSFTDGSVFEWYEYKNEYDTQDNLIKVTRSDNAGNIYDWCEYEYNTQGNVTKKTYYISTGDMDSWCEYEYDAQGNMIKMAFYDPYADISQSYLRKYEYDFQGNTPKHITYNADGSLMLSLDEASNNTKNEDLKSNDDFAFTDDIIMILDSMTYSLIGFNKEDITDNDFLRQAVWLWFTSGRENGYSDNNGFISYPEQDILDFLLNVFGISYNVESLHDGEYIICEDGKVKISCSDYADYSFVYKNYEMVDNGYLVYYVIFTNSPEELVGIATFQIERADNNNGFIVSGYSKKDFQGNNINDLGCWEY